MNAFQQHFGASVLLVVLSFLQFCLAEAWSICLMTPPCGCLPDSLVYCAYKGIQSIPPYGQSPEIIWKQLDLSENFLTTIPDSGLKGIKVEYLNLARNAISKLYGESFSGLPETVTLDLSHNHLKDLPPRFLQPMAKLSTLRLKFNQISSITPEAFLGAQHITEVDLTGNDLSSVPGAAIRLLSSLRSLIIRSNNLKSVDPYSFYNLPLEYLDLGNNGASVDIHQSAFCGLDPRVESSEPGVTDWSGLHTLRLDHNGLREMDPCVTKMLWTLTTVDLSGNPLHCNCQLLTLRGLGTKTEFPEAQCASPARLAGQYLDDINSSKCSGISRPTNCNEMCSSPPPVLKLTYEVSNQAHVINSETAPYLACLCLLLASVSLILDCRIILGIDITRWHKSWIREHNNSYNNSSWRLWVLFWHAHMVSNFPLCFCRCELWGSGWELSVDSKGLWDISSPSTHNYSLGILLGQAISLAPIHDCRIWLKACILHWAYSLFTVPHIWLE